MILDFGLRYLFWVGNVIGGWQVWDIPHVVGQPGEDCTLETLLTRILESEAAPSNKAANDSPSFFSLKTASAQLINPVMPMSWNHTAALVFQEVHSVMTKGRGVPFSLTNSGGSGLVLSVIMDCLNQRTVVGAAATASDSESEVMVAVCRLLTPPRGLDS